MDTGDMYLGERNQDPVSQEQFVKKVSKAIKSNKDDFSYVVSIPSARTPIVKMHHNYTELDCDISFRHGLGVENTKFLR
jgi:DNA polymerase sigma